MLLQLRSANSKFARSLDIHKIAVPGFACNPAQARSLARIGTLTRALAILQTAQAASSLELLTRTILKNNALAYSIVQAWMAERNLYFIPDESWKRLDNQ
jgi:hypothetical protein